jgi:hypothetical protein
MQAYLTMILTALNWFPGVKTRVAAVAALLLAVVAAWNSAAPAIGVDFIITVPEWLTAATLALLGVGAANQPANVAAKK